MKTFLVPLIRREAYGFVLIPPQRKTAETQAYNKAAAEIFALADNDGWDRDSALPTTIKEGEFTVTL